MEGERCMAGNELFAGPGKRMDLDWEEFKTCSAAGLKLFWKTCTGNTLGSSWIQDMYLKKQCIWEAKPHLLDSEIWKHILTVKHEAMQCFMIQIGDGNSTSLLYDLWTMAESRIYWVRTLLKLLVQIIGLWATLSLMVLLYILSGTWYSMSEYKKEETHGYALYQNLEVMNLLLPGSLSAINIL